MEPLNGTGKEGLLAQLEEINISLYNLIEALRRGAPHSRDYCVQGITAYAEARGQYEKGWPRLKN